MKIKLEITSNEIIKPSSPIPSHPQTYQLSFLDQVSPKVYSPVIFYYKLTSYEDKFNIVEIANTLKRSLSQVLTIFYPLAGQVKDLFVDCNDNGVPFSQTLVKCRLSDVLGNPNPNELCNLLPFDKLYDITEFALGVRLNVFQCGGIALGLCVSHRVADGYSIVMFVRTWIAIARGEEVDLRPDFSASKLFPPRNTAGFDPSGSVTRQSVVTKRFVFGSKAIEAIRAKFERELSRYLQGNGDHPHSFRPSRVELLSAFVWRRVVASTVIIKAPTTEKFYAVIHAVNLRPKFDPPLREEQCFGNMFRLGLAFLGGESSDLEECSHGLMRQIREGIRRVDKEYVKGIQRGGLADLEVLKGYARSVLTKGGSTNSLVTFYFSSVCKFPLYEVDFGWGEPIWVSSTAIPFENAVGFMETKTGDGIEVYVTLKEQDMPRFEADQEFCQFVR